MINEKTCTSSKHLLEKLSAINQREGTWIFRGQTDARNPLLPTLYRDNCSLHELVANDMRHFECTSPERLEDEAETNRIRLALLHAYCNDLAHKLEKLLGSVGIPIPVNHNFINPVEMNRGGTQRLFENYLGHIRRDLHIYGPGEIIHAYARHSGLPSSLMDWTYDFEVAAFFACYTDIHSQQRTETDYAVWAINQAVINETDLRRHPQANAATGQVLFMQKQSALFLYDNGQGDYYIRESKWRTFEDLFNEPTVGDDLVHKFILPSSEKENLKKFLAKRYVIKSQLMPTIYTAAEDVMSGKIEWLND